MRIQICPALMDGIVFLVFFAVLYGAGARGLSSAQCAWLGGIPQIAYMATSITIGAFLTRRNARGWLLAGTVACGGFGAAALLVTAFRPLWVLLVLFCVALSVFFNAFQTFMRGETQPGGLARTVGRYTLAWSLGSSLGFLSSGSAYRLGPAFLAGLDGAVALGILGILLTHRGRPHHEASAEEHVESAGAAGRPVNPAFVGVAWCMIFTAMFVQRPVQNFFPAICARQGIAPFLAGLPLFLHMLVQGLGGYGVHWMQRWRYRRTPLAWFHLGAAAAFLVLFLYPQFWVCMVLVPALGLYTGYAYFSAVYYASNSGRRSLNVGVNECLVGLGSFAGLYAAETWMRRFGNDAVMYAVCAAALLFSLFLQLLIASLGPTGRAAENRGVA